MEQIRPAHAKATSTQFSTSPNSHIYIQAFIVLFLFRYIRAIVNVVTNQFHRPYPPPLQPSYSACDVTVVIPTTDLSSVIFGEVIQSALKHQISSLIITTAGAKVTRQSDKFKARFRDPRIIVLYRDEVNKRGQIASAMQFVDTDLVIIADDHTFWPASSTFLLSLIAPFEDLEVGAVGPIIEARHRNQASYWHGFWNFMGMTYLSRRAHDFVAINTIDGGVTTLSSRYAAFRTEIYKSKSFLHHYLNEYIWSPRGWVGPLNADDDNFHTRWLTNHGWKIKIQSSPETTMTTELGEWPKFMSQVLRWNRTDWRSIPRALFTERISWVRYPYTTYSHLLYSLLRFTLFYEMSLFWLLHRTLEGYGHLEWFKVAAFALGVWVTGMRFVKIFPHFRRYPKDLVYFPAYLAFCYFCSFLKVWACLTYDNAYWSTADIPTLNTDEKRNGPNANSDTRVAEKTVDDDIRVQNSLKET